MGSVLTLSELGAWAQAHAAQGRRVVLCHGTFDLVHPGHLQHLQQARAHGDILAVTVTADEFVVKGPGRPAFSAMQRAAFLSSLREVDAVAIVEDPSAIPALEALKPSIYAKGPDYAARNPEADDKLQAEKAVLERHGGRLVFTDGEKISSSTLINAHLQKPDVTRYLAALKTRHTAQDVAQWLERAAPLSVTVLGEPITDEYVFVHPEGKAAKENLVVFRQTGQREYQGGVNAVSNHVQLLADNVRVLDGNMVPVIKRRYLDDVFHNKLFEVTQIQRPPPLACEDLDLGAITVIADFGHGLITPDCPRFLCERATFLALMVQANGLNWGFNTLQKWPRADYVVCDEIELRLASRNREGDLLACLKTEHHRLGARLTIVTRGHLGAWAWDGRDLIEAPAFADKVVDRMGAGDAFLGCSAPLAAIGAPTSIVALVGSAAAALKVRKLGNEAVTRKELKRWLMGMLA